MIRRIDAHHHLWTVASGHFPMLSNPPVARFWGNSAELPRDYSISTFLADALAEGVVASVHVEAAFDPPEAEAAAIQGIADAHGFPQAFLTRIDLAADNARARIDSDRQFANWRGVRITAPWPRNPAGKLPTPFANPDWRAGFAALGDAGGVADMMVWPEQISDVAALARDFPEVLIVVEHFALADGSEAWDAGMAELARHANVAVKLSGPGLVRRDWSEVTIRPWIARLVGLFGCERLMIGSNAPVDLVMASYPTIVKRFDAAIADLSAEQQRALWHDTAAHIYQIETAA